MKTHHSLPNVLITNGNQTETHELRLTSADVPELLITTRVGLGGEVVRRPYLITPALPEMIVNSPMTFLQQLADLIKFRSFDSMDDLWLEELKYSAPNGEVTTLSVELSAFEKYAFELKQSQTLHLNISPGTTQYHVEI